MEKFGLYSGSSYFFLRNQNQFSLELILTLGSIAGGFPNILDVVQEFGLVSDNFFPLSSHDHFMLKCFIGKELCKARKRKEKMVFSVFAC